MFYLYKIFKNRFRFPGWWKWISTGETISHLEDFWSVIVSTTIILARQHRVSLLWLRMSAVSSTTRHPSSSSLGSWRIQLIATLSHLAPLPRTIGQSSCGLGARNANRQVGRTICVSSSRSDAIFTFRCRLFLPCLQKLGILVSPSISNCDFMATPTVGASCPALIRLQFVRALIRCTRNTFIISAVGIWSLLSSTRQSRSKKLSSPNPPSLYRSSRIYCRSSSRRFD